MSKELLPLPAELEDALEEYWNTAYKEGKTGANLANDANLALHKIRTVIRNYARDSIVDSRRATSEATIQNFTIDDAVAHDDYPGAPGALAVWAYHLAAERAGIKVAEE